MATGRLTVRLLALALVALALGLLSAVQPAAANPPPRSTPTAAPAHGTRPAPATPATASAFGPAASPVAGETPGGKPKSARPKFASEPGGDLTYAGGPVMHSSSTYAIFWLPAGKHYESDSAGDTNYENLLTRFLSDVGGSPFYNILTQYSDQFTGSPLSASTFGGSFTDTTAYPTTCTTASLCQSDFLASVNRALAANPSWTPNATSAFFVFTAAGADTQTNPANACPYFNASTVQNNQTLIYAGVPEGTGSGCEAEDAHGNLFAPNGDTAADSEVSLLSRVLFDTVANGDFSSSISNASHGWEGGVAEIDTACAGQYGSVNASGSNINLNGHPYIVQQEWSNLVGGCVLSMPPLAPGWTFQQPASHPGSVAAVAADPQAGNVVLLTQDSPSQTWTWNGSAWTHVTPAHTPSARVHAEMAYDAANHDVVLFGGHSNAGPSSQLGDTWIWNGSDWLQQAPANSPSPRQDVGLAWDGHQVVLFGGDAGTFGILSDTWTWNGTNWMPICGVGGGPICGPTARDTLGLTFDAAHGDAVLFGGQGCSDPSCASLNYLGDTWTWNGSTLTWTQQSPAVSPPTRQTTGLVSTTTAGKVLLLGADWFGSGGGLQTTDLWSWDGSDWSPICGTVAPSTPACAPFSRGGAAVAINPSDGSLLLFGGSPSFGVPVVTVTDTWTWTGSSSPLPAVASVSPDSGAATGGTAVTISGQNLGGAMSISFGSSPATSVTCTNTRCTATSPAAVAGIVDVTVTTAAGTSTVYPLDQFAYLPSVSGVNPTSGSGLGGTSVAVTGSGFSTTAGATSINFGANPATNVSCSPTACTATSPAGPPQPATVDVTATVNGQTSPVSSADQFTYTAPPAAPVVTRVQPNSGPAAGGTSVAVTGTGFTGATAVSFGAAAAKSVTVNSDTSIAATSPAGSGSVDVTVTAGGQTSATSSSDLFTYQGTPSDRWLQQSPSVSPSARDAAAMAYDAALNETILFGGEICIPTQFGCNEQFLNDTWAWNGNTWTQLCTTAPCTTNLPPARANALMAYDAQSKQLVLFGGNGGGDTWIWNGATWTQQFPSVSPPTFNGSAMTYDAVRGQIVLFAPGNTTTWVWDGTDWSEKFPATIPFENGGASMAYDAAHQQDVLFLAADDSNFNLLGFTWIWDGTNWTEQSPVVSPPPPINDGMSFDGSQVVLFGGCAGQFSCTPPLGDTWTWDGAGWTAVCGTTSPSTPACGPSSRENLALAYDPTHNAVVLFGGLNGTTNDGDTWLWHGSGSQPANAPSVTGLSPASGSVSGGTSITITGQNLSGATGVSFGSAAATGVSCTSAQCTATFPAGSVGVVDVTVTTPAGTSPISVPDRFTYLPAVTSLGTTSGPAAGNTSVTVTGAGFTNATQVAFGNEAAASFTVNSDTQITATTPPGSGAVDVVVSVNALASALTGADRFSYTGSPTSGWALLLPPASPAARSKAALAFDEKHSHALFFGGEDANDNIYGDTWTWNGTTWTQQQPPTSPRARFGALMAYDGTNQNVVLFGGMDSNGNQLTDTWVWDGTTWTQKTPQASPPFRTGASMSYDGHQVVFFGGCTAHNQFGSCTNALGDTWTWNGTTWTQQTASPSPSARTSAALTYDPATSTAVLFGGCTTSPFGCAQGDTWNWNGSTDTWAQTCTASPCTSTTPPARENAGLAFDGARLVLFGGDNGSGAFSTRFSDTWGWDGSVWTKLASVQSPSGGGPTGMVEEPAQNGTLLFGDSGSQNTWLWFGTAPQVSGSLSKVAVAPPGTAPDNGTFPVTVTVTIKSPAGSPVSGQTVSLGQALSGGGTAHSTIGPPSGPSDQNGVVTFSVKDQTPEVVTYSATAGGVPIATTASVSFELQGDVNLNGVVDAVDALCVLRDVAELPATPACPQTPATLSAADVARTGNPPSAVDALCVLRIVAKLPPTPACPQFDGGRTQTGSRQSAMGSRPAAGGAAGGGATPSALATTPALTLQPAAVDAATGKQSAVTLTFDGSRIADHVPSAPGRLILATTRAPSRSWTAGWRMAASATPASQPAWCVSWAPRRRGSPAARPLQR